MKYQRTHLKLSVREIEIYVLKAILKEIYIYFNKKKLASDLIIKTKKGNVIKGYATNKTF